MIVSLNVLSLTCAAQRSTHSLGRNNLHRVIVDLAGNLAAGLTCELSIFWEGLHACTINVSMETSIAMSCCFVVLSLSLSLSLSSHLLHTIFPVLKPKSGGNRRLYNWRSDPPAAAANHHQQHQQQSQWGLDVQWRLNHVKPNPTGTSHLAIPTNAWHVLAKKCVTSYVWSRQPP